MSSRGLSALLVLLAFGVYAIGITSPFQFDDLAFIVNNEGVKDLWSLEGARRRPVLFFSFSLNHAISGMEPVAFRLTNIVIHACAGLLLFGVVRRLLRRPAFGSLEERTVNGLAFAVAALWLVHPLNTSAVTYVYQRAESQMGMFFLGTIYATLRSAGDGRRGLWIGLAIGSFLLGLGTKETMVAVMPVLLLVDGLLVAGTFQAALRARWPIYSLFALVLVGGTIFVLPSYTTSLGEFSRWQYASSQPGVVLDYLRLAVLPYPQCFDWYHKPVEGLMAILPAALAIAGLLAVIVRLLLRRSWQGIAGAWVFLVIAPTSSVVVINDLMCEYRMYVPLIGVVALGVGLGRTLCKRFGVPRTPVLAAALLAYGGLAVLENANYRSVFARWSSVLDVQPENSRAHGYLVQHYLTAGDKETALHHARESFKYRPHFLTHFKLAIALRANGDLEGALRHLKKCAKFRKRNRKVWPQIAALHLGLNQPRKAADAFRRAIKRDKKNPVLRERLARVCMGIGELDAAVKQYTKALRADPSLADTASELALRKAASDAPPQDREKALRIGEVAVEVTKRQLPKPLGNLAQAYAALGQKDRARAICDEMLRLPAIARNPKLRAQVQQLRARLGRD